LSAAFGGKILTWDDLNRFTTQMAFQLVLRRLVVAVEERRGPVGGESLIGPRAWWERRLRWGEGETAVVSWVLRSNVALRRL
jgi:hypothetical protein